jgi:hypothetical protein
MASSISAPGIFMNEYVELTKNECSDITLTPRNRGSTGDADFTQVAMKFLTSDGNLKIDIFFTRTYHWNLY